MMGGIDGEIKELIKTIKGAGKRSFKEIIIRKLKFDSTGAY